MAKLILEMVTHLCGLGAVSLFQNRYAEYEVRHLCSPDAERAEGWTRSDHLIESLLHCARLSLSQSVPYICSPDAERAEGWTRSNHLVESLLHCARLNLSQSVEKFDDSYLCSPEAERAEGWTSCCVCLTSHPNQIEALSVAVLRRYSIPNSLPVPQTMLLS